MLGHSFFNGSVELSRNVLGALNIHFLLLNTRMATLAYHLMSKVQSLSLQLHDI